ncbi:MAG: oxidoreductase [Actinomycetia bacterium]|nr:oxidoreductase [Actinomycetes bacterium]
MSRGRRAAAGSRTRPGDRVVGWADAPAGSYAEYALASTYTALPDGVDFPAVVTLPVAMDAATRGLDVLKVGAGDTLLIHGASGTELLVAGRFLHSRSTRSSRAGDAGLFLCPPARSTGAGKKPGSACCSPTQSTESAGSAMPIYD